MQNNDFNGSDSQNSLGSLTETIKDNVQNISTSFFKNPLFIGLYKSLIKYILFTFILVGLFFFGKTLIPYAKLYIIDVKINSLTEEKKSINERLVEIETENKKLIEQKLQYINN